jgi:hypothetical protein
LWGKRIGVRVPRLIEKAKLNNETPTTVILRPTTVQQIATALLRASARARIAACFLLSPIPASASLQRRQLAAYLTTTTNLYNDVGNSNIKNVGCQDFFWVFWGVFFAGKGPPEAPQKDR